MNQTIQRRTRAILFFNQHVSKERYFYNDLFEIFFMEHVFVGPILFSFVEEGMEIILLQRSHSISSSWCLFTI